ncbi:MAG: restriction endonuclease [Lentisphaerae bacterium]|nr:restriction endonuclease [Lentisphaerota bacterium]
MQMMEWTEYKLEELLAYEQPTAYIVNSTDYHESYKTPVLTAGKSFIIGYTDETTGIYDKLPVIIFDDFTTASQYVNFQFKVKSSAMKILTANSELVLPKFIFYRMQTIQFDHSTHKRYWIQQYSQIKVKVPPLPEQERIVAKIEELFSQLDAAVTELKSVKEKLAIYRQAVLTAVFPSVSGENMVTLDSISEISGGITKGRDLTNVETIELPYLRVANVQNGYLDLSEVKAIKLKVSEKQKYLLQLDDVLYTEGGDRDKLGRGTLWKNEISECVHQNHIFKARINKNKALPQYVALWSMSSYARNYFYHKGKQSVNLASINKTVLSALPIPLPSILEQKKIVENIEEKLSVCNNIEQTVDTALQQAAALRQSILKQAFEGNL